MAYIGRDITSLSNAAILDAITFSDSAGPYNLTKSTVAFTPISAQALVISVDGVIQDPGSYTISAATITFDSTMSSSATNDFIVHNGVGIVNEVSDGAVTTAKLGTDAVTTAKILDNNVTVAKLPTTLDISGNTVTLPASVSGLGTGITASQLTSTLDISSKTITLPASVSGLGTGITNAQLAGSIDVTSKITGVVPSANLGSGTASSSTILYGDSTYKSEPAGGAWNLLATTTASGASEANFVHGSGGVDLTTYKMYKLLGIDLDTSDDDVNPIILWSDDAGVSYETSNYATSMNYLTYGGSVSASGSTSESLFFNNIGNAAGETGSFEFTFPNPSSALHKVSWGLGVTSPATGDMRLIISGSTWTSTADVDAFQFKMSAGTFDGILKLYGIS